MGCRFEDTLHYSSPANGGRGIVRTGMLIPESVELFVCPFACGRHGSISAVKQNFKDRLVYLYLEQSDIIEGYDDVIVPAVGELLESLPKRPKVILIFVSCLDDLIGTDHDALKERLSALYPDVQFRSCHMNPITTGGKTPPPISIQNDMYSLLKKQEEQDNGVNSIGNLAAVSEDSEVHTYLSHMGYGRLRHISQYDTFDGYQEMAKSQFNLVIAPAGRQAAEQMEERLKKPHLFLPVSYRLEEIEQQYKKLTEWLKKDSSETMDLTPYIERTKKSIERAREAVGDMPIIVDASAVVRPFSMARALLEYGFHVVRIQAQECISIDRSDFEWLEREHPEVEVMQPRHHKAVLQDKRIRESIAIGVDGAYLTGSDYVVDLFADEGMYGYHGVECLMEKLENALEQKVDLENMINEYGLVV